MVGRSSLVGLGIGVSGLGTLLMLSLFAHSSTPSEFAVFAGWWIAATLVSFPLGVFEVLLARHVVADISAGRSARAATSTILGRVGLLVAVVAVGFVALDSLLADAIFDGVSGLGVAIAVYLVIAVAQVLQRGHATGTDRFDLVCLQLSTDGIFRLMGVGAVVALGDWSSRSAAFGVCAGALLSVVVTHAGSPTWLQTPRLRNPAMSLTPVLVLLAGSIGPLLINNASVPWLSYRSDAVLVGAFAGALTLTRIPIQLSGAVFGPLLNRISHAVEARDEVAFHSLNRRAVSWSIGIALGFVACFTAFGSLALRLYIGDEYDLPTTTYLALASSSAAMLVSIVAQAGAAANERWKAISLSWLLAAAAFALVLVLPLSVLHRATLAPLVASLVGLAGLTLAARRNWDAQWHGS